MARKGNVHGKGGSKKARQQAHNKATGKYRAWIIKKYGAKAVFK